MVKVKVQSKTGDKALDAIKTAVSSEIKRLEIGLRKTNRQIDVFEKKYKVSSLMFRRRLSAEDLKGGDWEYIEWMGELKLRERIMSDLDNLKAIKYVA